MGTEWYQVRVYVDGGCDIVSWPFETCTNAFFTYSSSSQQLQYQIGCTSEHLLEVQD